MGIEPMTFVLQAQCNFLRKNANQNSWKDAKLDQVGEIT